MTNISLEYIRKLRERTGIGIMECKKALIAVEGDIEQAVDWLRKQGLIKAAKKANRIAMEGLIGVFLSSDHQSASIIEVNTETDFVARNNLFQKFVIRVAELGLKTNNLNDLLESEYEDNKTVKEILAQNIATLGEKQVIRRMEKIDCVTNNGICVTYVHSCFAPNLGRIGVIVQLSSNVQRDVLQQFGKKIAMHIAASKPQFLKIENISNFVLDREKSILLTKAQESNKPKHVIEKMIEGGLRKFYEEVVLLEQNFIFDSDKKVKDFIALFEKETGHPVYISSFVLMVLGEGIEKEKEDFAASAFAKTIGVY